MTNNNFETEKNVRKAIENLEILTSKVAKDQISRSHIITSILDQLSLMRVILSSILNADELAQSKKRLEDLMKLNALETHSKIVEQEPISRISK